MVHDRTVKVLYIAGWGRSGSTILGDILGQMEGFFHAGELSHIWDRNLGRDVICGCGKEFRACEVWQGVFDHAFGGVDRIDPQRMIRSREASARTRHIPLALMPGVRTALVSRTGSYLRRLETLYRSIGSVTGSKVIVDSSKNPSYGYLLSTIPAIDLRVVHLIRDPRGVAFSWSRRKLERGADPPAYMRRMSSIRSSVLWVVWSMATEALWGRSAGRYMLLRYEDAMERPPETVGRILDLVQEEVPQLPFVSQHRVRLTSNHTTSGNPSRFKSGSVALRTDREWEVKMSRAHKLLATAITWPLLPRYGYPLRA